MGQDHELGRRRLKDAADFVRTYRFDLSNYVLVGVSGANLYGPRGALSRLALDLTTTRGDAQSCCVVPGICDGAR